MNKNTIYILILSTLIALTRILIRKIKYSRKNTFPKYTKEEIEYNNILDNITELCVEFRTNDKEKYTEEQLTVVAATQYYDEVMNGGLCQFFANSSRNIASILSISLEKINSKEHKSHFDKFIKDNKINIKKLDSFVKEDKDDFISQYDEYPFEDFDNKFYDIDKTEKLCDLIVKYAKKNYKNIFTNIKNKC